MDLSQEQLKELKKAVNTLIAERRIFDASESSKEKLEENKIKLGIDYKILSLLLQNIV